MARYADAVHSVDRTKVVAALDRGAAAAGRRVQALVQVSLDGDPGRGGVRAAATCAGWPTRSARRRTWTCAG